MAGPFLRSEQRESDGRKWGREGKRPAKKGREKGERVWPYKNPKQAPPQSAARPPNKTPPPTSFFPPERERKGGHRLPLVFLFFRHAASISVRIQLPPPPPFPYYSLPLLAGRSEGMGRGGIPIRSWSMPLDRREEGGRGGNPAAKRLIGKGGGELDRDHALWVFPFSLPLPNFYPRSYFGKLLGPNLEVGRQKRFLWLAFFPFSEKRQLEKGTFCLGMYCMRLESTTAQARRRRHHHHLPKKQGHASSSSPPFPSFLLPSMSENRRRRRMDSKSLYPPLPVARVPTRRLLPNPPLPLLYIHTRQMPGKLLPVSLPPTSILLLLLRTDGVRMGPIRQAGTGGQALYYLGGGRERKKGDFDRRPRPTMIYFYYPQTMLPRTRTKTENNRKCHTRRRNQDIFIAPVLAGTLQTLGRAFLDHAPPNRKEPNECCPPPKNQPTIPPSNYLLPLFPSIRSVSPFPSSYGHAQSDSAAVLSPLPLSVPSSPSPTSFSLSSSAIWAMRGGRILFSFPYIASSTPFLFSIPLPLKGGRLPATGTKSAFPYIG